MNYVVGVDIGGTFTDCVVVDEGGKVTIGKALSTPADFAEGALNAADDAAQNVGLKNSDELLSATQLFFHACTIGDNTLITRAGAKTGLILTKGFGDTLHMMRGKIAEGLTENEIAHRSALDKPEPFVPRKLVEEVPERIDYKGKELIRLDVEAAEQAIDRLVSKGVESIAVCFLWSIINDDHERQLAELLKKKYPKLFFTLSSDVAPYLGEYERSATTVFNAYIGPKISSYLQNLQTHAPQQGPEARAVDHAGLWGRAGHRGHLQKCRRYHRVRSGGGHRRHAVFRRAYRGKEYPGNGYGRDDFQSQRHARRRNRAGLQTGHPAPQHSLDQDMGGVHRRGRRQHRLDRSRNRLAQSRSPGRRGSRPDRSVTRRWHRADGFRCGPGVGLSQRELFSRRPDETKQSEDDRSDPRKNCASRSK